MNKTHADIIMALDRIGAAHIEAYGVNLGAVTAFNIIQEMKAFLPEKSSGEEKEKQRD